MPITVPSKPEQRRDRRDRAERIEIALEFVYHVPAGVLDDLLEHLAALVAIGKPGGQHHAHRRIGGQYAQVLLVELAVAGPFPDTHRQVLSAARGGAAASRAARW
jgi:hypothetical protein